MKEFTLPSGAILKVQSSPFAASKALYQALLRELKTVSFASKAEMGAFARDILCIGFSSPEIEKCLWECFKRCTYNEVLIDKDTFEPVERRDDYMQVCIEVARENVMPFMKSLYVQYADLMKTAVENTPS